MLKNQANKVLESFLKMIINFNIKQKLKLVED